jgi:hypothetical protein
MDSSKVATSGASRLAEILTVKANEAQIWLRMDLFNSFNMSHLREIDCGGFHLMGKTKMEKRKELPEITASIV